ncbi:unnamed protein product [Ilex paraguariensis]|uniref:Ubiquitin-like protease family profile domain-containing protein n=1 Tax=Ilex paraguariensis TaxID=185542 RepID=A0ABC8RGI0_9AQUA
MLVLVLLGNVVLVLLGNVVLVLSAIVVLVGGGGGCCVVLVVLTLSQLLSLSHLSLLRLASFSWEVSGDQILKHRSCWRHVAASVCANKENLTQHDAEEMITVERTSPCFLGTFPCRKRSRRARKCQNKVSNPKKKLNSETFEHYLENIWRTFSEDRMASFTRFDSLWFSLYLKASSREKVLTWMRRQDIFSKKYVLVPIVCWLVLDIYKAEGRSENKKLISRIPLLVPKVPQQKNGDECGYFVLYFINLFVGGAPESFSIKEGYPYFMKQNWFGYEGLEDFCKQFYSERIP